MSARAEPRFTRDADIAVVVTDDRDAEALIRSLHDRGYRAITAVEQEAARRLATVRLAPAGSPAGVVIDLLFASSGIEAEVATAAERLEVLPGLQAPVARLGHLLALKILAQDDRTRPQDRADIVALLREARASDLDTARAALRLIAERGFHRDRALLADFEAAVAAHRP